MNGYNFDDMAVEESRELATNVFNNGNGGLGWEKNKICTGKTCMKDTCLLYFTVFQCDMGMLKNEY